MENDLTEEVVRQESTKKDYKAISKNSKKIKKAPAKSQKEKPTKATPKKKKNEKPKSDTEMSAELSTQTKPPSSLQMSDNKTEKESTLDLNSMTGSPNAAEAPAPKSKRCKKSPQKKPGVKPSVPSVDDVINMILITKKGIKGWKEPVEEIKEKI